MGSWWRSEEMAYCSFIVSEEAALSCVRELGILGCVQFSDLNPDLTPFQRRYMAYIKRCDEIERKIRYMHGEIKKMEPVIHVQPGGDVDNFIEKAHLGEKSSGAYLLESLESKLEAHEQQLLDLNKYNAKLTDEYSSKVEYFTLLKKAADFKRNFESISKGDGGDDYAGQSQSVNPLLAESGSGGAEDMAFSNIAGALDSKDKQRFERMLFRATRGNCYVRFSAMNESSDAHSHGKGKKNKKSEFDEEVVDANGKLIEKDLFVIFYKSQTIEGKIKRICDAFNAHRYDLSNLGDSQALRSMQSAISKEMIDAKTVVDKNMKTRYELCVLLAKDIEEWLWIVRREKSMYHTLNLFKNDVAGAFLRGRGWILKDMVGKARSALFKAHVALNLPQTALMEAVPAAYWPTPPTHFRTNKYTYAFQEFVNTYGIPRYQEANPALFTAATFPFLFGVMYGDIGHGSVLTLAAAYLVLTEKKMDERGADGKKMDEMLHSIYGARYMLLGMGICAVYAGLIYNDYFSLGINFFGTTYSWHSYETGEKAKLKGDYGDPLNVYPFGVDPAWHIAANELLFFNSMKMKMSVVLGIIQMIWGVCLKGANALHYRSYLDLFCEFVPQMIFAVGFFGYMVILIFVKWSINWDQRMALGSCNYNKFGKFGGCNLSKNPNGCFSYLGKPCVATTLLNETCPLNFGGSGNGCQPPNLITTLINIALKPGTVDEPMYSGQGTIQTIILLVAFISVPWMLVIKPCILNHYHKKELKEKALLGEGDAHGHGHGHGHKPAAGGKGGVAEKDTKNPLLAGAEDHSALNPHVEAETEVMHDPHSHDHGEFNFGEVMIHQAIETIEFVLGMVSNTASYLRLWALSLAHTELATVFWEKAMLSAIDTNSPIAVVIGFFIFAMVTFGVLLAMDVLECFLHALRLHWVEFQNKFYKADGYRFVPFEFKQIISASTLE